MITLTKKVQRFVSVVAAVVMAAMSGAAFAGDDINEVRAALARELASRSTKARLLATASSVTDLGNGLKRYVWDATGSDLGVVKEQGETIAISFPVDVHFFEIKSVSIEAEAWDVDYPEATEHDVVYFNGSSIGRLQGGNNSSHLNTFRALSPNLVKVPATLGEVAQNTFSVKVDVGNEGWVTAINWAKLTIEGREGIEVDATDGTEPEGVKVTWTSVPGATYTLYRGEAKGAKDKRLYGGTDLEFLDEEAEPGKIYFYTVEAVVGSGSGSGSGPQLLAASGGTIEGSNDGYYDAIIPYVVKMELPDFWLENKAPLAITWNKYDEKKVRVSECKLFLSGSCTKNLTMPKAASEERVVFDATAEKKFMNNDFGVCEVKVMWKVEILKDKVWKPYKDGTYIYTEESKKSIPIYFNKYEGATANWYLYWPMNGAISAGFVGDHGEFGYGSAGEDGNEGGGHTPGFKPLSNFGPFPADYPPIYKLSGTVSHTYTVSDVAASQNSQYTIGPFTVGSNKTGVECLAETICHERRHGQVADERYGVANKYFIGKNQHQYRFQTIEQLVEDIQSKQWEPRFVAYTNAIISAYKNGDYICDLDGDGILDSFEDGPNARYSSWSFSSTTPDSHGVSNEIDSEYSTYGDDELLARWAETHPTIDITVETANDWAFPGTKINQNESGLRKAQWDSSSAKQEAMATFEPFEDKSAPKSLRSGTNKSIRAKLLGGVSGNVTRTGGDLVAMPLLYDMPGQGISIGNNVSDRTADYLTDHGYSCLALALEIGNDGEVLNGVEVYGYLVDSTDAPVAFAKTVLDTLPLGSNEVLLEFPGVSLRRIRSAGYRLVAVKVVRFIGDSGIIEASKADFNETFFTYSYNQFVGGDANLFYNTFSESTTRETLTVEVEGAVSVAGKYGFEARLENSDGEFVAMASVIRDVPEGEFAIPLVFSGEDIYLSHLDGPYRVCYIRIVQDGETIEERRMPYTTAEYRYSDFAPANVLIVVDEDSFSRDADTVGSDGAIDNLAFSFNVEYRGNSGDQCRVKMSLYGTNDTFVCSVENVFKFTSGINTVRLAFDGARVSLSGIGGPYYVRDVILEPSTGAAERFFPNMEALELKAQDFGAYPFKVNGKVQFYQNSTGIGCYLYVPLTIQRANTVTVSAMLVDASGQFVAMATGTRTYTEPCDDGITISFSEHDILASERKGPYSVRFVQIASDIAGVVPLRAEVPTEAAEISTSYTRYVNCYAWGAEADGYSWNTAFRDIQSAVDAANDGDLILVADGTYAPFETYNKSIEIRSVNGWTVTEIDANEEMRCATLGRDESSTNTVLVGFTLSDGNATTDSTLTLWNCGGGVCGGTVRNCRITSCTASKGGGAYYSWLENCLIDHNVATTYGGGAYGSVAVNCTIANNGISSWYSSNGGGVYMGGCWNSIVYDNYYDDSEDSASNYAECQMYYCSTYPQPSSGVGNVTSYPYFKDPGNGDYSLERYSYCIDAGRTSIAPGDQDLSGGARVCDGVVDIGAFEFQTHSYSDGECGFREYDEKGGEGGTLSIPVWGGHPDHASSVKVYVVPCTATTADLNLGKTKPPLVLKWNAGEVGTKYLKIPLKKDSIVEGSESLSLVLGSASGMTLTENRAIKLTIDDATSSVTLAEALNNVKLKPSTGGAGKWKPVEGRLDYRYESHVRPVFADSPALKKGKSSTLNLGTFKGKGRLYYRFMFYGDESDLSSKTKLQAFDGKTKYSPHTAASVSSGWNYYYLDLGSGTHKVSLKVTQGAASYTRVRVTDIAWIPAGKTAVSTFTYSWPEEGGVVVGGGMHPAGTVLTLKAKVRSGWRFDRWYRYSDWATVGTNATLKVTASGTETYYATFTKLNTVRVLPYPAEGGTVSGGGFYANWKTATLKATPAKNYYLEGWYPADPDDPNKMHKNKFCSYGDASTLKITAYGDETYFANFLPCPKLTLKTDNANGGSVKGTGQYQPGKTATLVATPKKGYAFTGWYDEDGNLVSLAATYKYKMTADGISFTASFKKESALAKPTLTWGDYVVGGDTEGTTSTSLTAGVVFSAKLTVAGESVVSIAKVAGLPSGLAYKSGKVSGVPTKAGKYTVTVTVALASNKKKVWTYKVPLDVEALPAFARGTFNGWSYYYDDGVEGGTVDVRKMTVSVTSAGKISATVGSLKFSGTGWTVDDEGFYLANLRTVRTSGTGKKAKKYTDVLSIWIDPNRAWTDDQLGGCVVTFSGSISLADALEPLNGLESVLTPMNTDTYVSARRNPFGDNDEAKAIAATLVAQGTHDFTDDAGLAWKVKMAANGVATISRTTGSGKNRKTTSATAVLEVEDDGAGDIWGVTRFLVSGKIIKIEWGW